MLRLKYLTTGNQIISSFTELNIQELRLRALFSKGENIREFPLLFSPP